MKIAIVGAGVAGLSAAWRLAQVHDVEIYEAQPRPGGHAWTVDASALARGGGVGGELGGELAAAPVAVDVGFQLFNQATNPNLSALFCALDVAIEPVEFSLSVVSGPDAWTNNGQRTRFGAAMTPEMIRFMRELPLFAGADVSTTLGALLSARGYSPDFTHRCLAPMLCFWWVSRAALLELPALVAASAALQGALAFFNPTSWSAVAGGAVNYVDRLARGLGSRLRLGHAVRRIERRGDRVQVYADGTEARAFDQVILAVDAGLALDLLGAPTPDERRLLGSARFEPATLVVHRDPSVMPADRALWSYGNFRELAAGSSSRALDGEMTYWRPRAGGGDVFVTVEAPGSRIDPAAVITRRAWRHRIIDEGVFSSGLSRIQGDARVWFCGGHTLGFPVHEHALCSGLAVAEALGGSFPFDDDAAAAQGYAAFKAQFFAN